MSRPLGCQARPWLQSLGPSGFASRLGEVMGSISALGFGGFETALACLPVGDPSTFDAMRSAAGGLRLAGAHAGGAWWDDSPEVSRDLERLIEVAHGLPALGCERLVVSCQGLPERPSGSQVDAFVARLSRLGSALRPAGVRVAFHNHAGEPADDARVIEAIVSRCAPEDVALGADLGWVAYAGVDVVSFVRRFGARLDHVHVRDVVRNPLGFIEIGRGTLDYPALLSALDAVGYSGWLMAESEFGEAWHGEPTPEKTARVQFEGLSRVVRDQEGPRPY